MTGVKVKTKLTPNSYSVLLTYHTTFGEVAGQWEVGEETQKGMAVAPWSPWVGAVGEQTAAT